MFTKLNELNTKQIITIIILVIYIPLAIYLTISGGLLILLIISGILYLAFNKWLKQNI